MLPWRHHQQGEGLPPDWGQIHGSHTGPYFLVLSGFFPSFHMAWITCRFRLSDKLPHLIYDGSVKLNFGPPQKKQTFEFYSFEPISN